MNNGIHQLVEAIQREAGGGCVKAVSLTVFIDGHGNVIGRSEFHTVRLYPAGIAPIVQGNETALAAALNGASK